MSFKVGVALGGGGARGLAHIGVLRELIAGGVQPDCVAGASIGSLVGAIFARRGRVEDIEARVDDFFKSEAFQNARLRALAQKDDGEGGGWFNTLAGIMRKATLYGQGITGRSMIDNDEYSALIGALVEDVEIGELKIPFAAVAADLSAAEEIVFTSGSLRMAVAASSAIPGVFPPVEEGGRLMVDGGWVDLVPIEPCRRLGADFVIGVDISQDPDENVDLKRSINILLRSNIVTRNVLRETQLKEADFVIRPPVGAYHWADFGNAKGLVELGAEAARNALKELKPQLTRKRHWGWLGL